MASKTTHKDAGGKSNGKVGSDPATARHVGGSGDFGVRADNRVAREYVSRETKQQDPTNEIARSGGPEQAADQGSRTSGVGGNSSGLGSSSGGDLDPDFTGVMGSFAQAGPDDRTDGPDMVREGDVEREASQASTSSSQSSRTSDEDNVDRTGDPSETESAAAVTNPEARGDDSFDGEISNDEASGAIENQ